MITSIRSFVELMVMTDSKSDSIKSNHDLNVIEESGQRKRNLHSISEEQVVLPDIANITKRKWFKSKRAIKRFLDDLDYNNQNISSYDITLMKKQEDKNYHDAA